jgi:DNA-binding Lrp family transcriptional regulator
MALSQPDKTLLYALQYSGDEPISKICRALRLKEGTAQGKIARWVREGKIQRRVFVNTYVLGLSEYEVYFSPHGKPSGGETALKKAVMGSDALRWFYRLAGSYDYSLGVEAARVSQIVGLLEDLDSRFPGLLSRKQIGAGIRYWWFGRRYLAPPGTRFPMEMEMAPLDDIIEIDGIDHRILQILGRQHLGSIRDLARAIGIPQETAAYRVRQLKHAGVIAGSPYIPSTDWLGVGVYRLLVAFRSFSGGVHRTLLSWCRQQRALVSMMRVLGNWDYTLRFEVENAEELVAIRDDLQMLFADELLRCDVTSVVKELVFSTYPHSHSVALPRPSPTKPRR